LVKQIDNLSVAISELPVVEELAFLKKLLDTIDADIKNTVLEHGGYQNLALGDYALQQERVSVSYNPVKVKEALPAKYAVAVIDETVNKTALEALVKSGAVDGKVVESIADKAVTTAWIIKNV
jgi:hypothetical protein